jgi:hypothetical protein
MLVGVGLFGVITANLAAYFLEDSDDAVGRKLDEMNDRLARLEELLGRPDARQ